MTFLETLGGYAISGDRMDGPREQLATRTRPRASWLSTASEPQRAIRQVRVARLGQERVEPAAHFNRTKRIGRNAQAHGLAERFADQRYLRLRFGRNRRLVRLLAWLTLLPTRTAFLPVSSQRRDMMIPVLVCPKSPATVSARAASIPKAAFYKGEQRGRCQGTAAG